jgi:hypothetical protein
MTKSESMLLEAVRNMLDADEQLGLKFHKRPEERSHKVQFKREDIYHTFRIKLNNSKISQFDNISAAFKATHDHCSIDDPRFDIEFKGRMSKSGVPVPTKEQDLAMKYLEEVRKEFDAGLRGPIANIPQYTEQTDAANMEKSTGYTNTQEDKP